jgi:hypothetical protein
VRKHRRHGLEYAVIPDQLMKKNQAMGQPFDDEEIGRVTWHLWFDKAGAGK